MSIRTKHETKLTFIGALLLAALAVLVTTFGSRAQAASVQAPVYAYVANSSNNTVAVIDTSSNAIIATIPVGRAPVGVALTPDGADLWVANASANTVSVVSTATNTVTATIPVGGTPFGLAFTPDGTLAYVTNLRGSSVSVIDTATNTVVQTVATANQPFSIAFTPDGNYAYVANFVGSSVSVIDTTTVQVVASISSTQVRTPAGVALTPDGAFAYTANFNSNNVSVIDTATNTIVAIIPGLVGPQAIAITPALNHPPTASCQHVTVAAGASCTASASIDNGSSDPDGDAITIAQNPTGPFSLGTTDAMLTVTDSNGASSMCFATVTVVDLAPPAITCPADITAKGNIPNSPYANVNPGSPTVGDNCASPTTVGTRSDGQPLDAPYPFGTTTITQTATDAAGNQASCQQTITVVPNAPTHKDECKDGGWQTFTNPTFKNQGDCVSFVQR